ncbi:hypothetical protein SFRURICE_003191 [Spodoptera frugiperda]|nr:hypothetical protein SFRURICE_003191 [Spodoptera frugiperda]
MIAEAMRVGVETKSESKQRENKPRPIVITLATRSERDKWLATRKSHQLTNDDIFANGNKQRIYINEDLTKYTRNLLWTAKNELKPKFKYIWVQNGRVLIKKDDPNDTKIRSIRTLSDINIYVENKQKLDIIALTEINIRKKESSLYNIEGFDTYISTRETRRGGGIFLYVNNKLNFTANVIKSSYYEMIHGQLCQNGRGMSHIMVVYRPPMTSKIGFIDEVHKTLSEIPATCEVILIGDTNLDLLCKTGSSTISQYTNNMSEIGMECGVCDVTREEVYGDKVTRTCIDHVWVRSQRVTAAYVLTCKLSDHYFIGVCLANELELNSDSASGVRSQRTVICDKRVLEKLHSVTWTELMDCKCPLDLYDRLCSMFYDIYDYAKIKLPVCNKRKSKPWITKELKHMISTRDKFFRYWKDKPEDMTLRIQYTKYRNRVNKCINKAKNKYCQEVIKNCNKNVRKIWEKINSWIGRQKKSVDSVILKYLSKSESTINICNKFSSMFTKEILDIKHVCSHKFLDRSNYVNNSNMSLRFQKAYPKDIDKIIERALRTVVDGVVGEASDVTCGVPTGSVFGPVGYIMHVNSMCNVVQKCRIYMYADDTCLVYADRDLDVIERNIQDDLTNIIKWAHDNGIIININKTKCMYIRSPYLRTFDRQPRVVGHSYECLHGDAKYCTCAYVEVVEEYKYLGLVIDNSFSWKTHITHLCDKLRLVLVKFHHLSFVLDRATMYTVYYALVDSLLSYGLACYGNTFKTYLDRIKCLQIRFMKLLVDKNTKKRCKHNDYYDELFFVCNMLPVHQKVVLLLAVETFCNKDLKVKTVSMRPARSKSVKQFIVPTYINYYGQRCRKYLVPSMFNDIPSELQNSCATKAVFKHKMKKYLFDSFVSH